MNLFETNANYQIAEDRLFASIDENGEVDPEALMAFQQIKEDRDTIIESCLLADKNDRIMVEALASEEKVLRERRKAIENRMEWREGYLTNILDGQKFETPKAKASFRKSEKVVVLDLEKIPEQFIKVKTETVPDKTLIKNELKMGKTVEGCSLETFLNIQIK